MKDKKSKAELKHDLSRKKVILAQQKKLLAEIESALAARMESVKESLNSN